MRMLDRIGIPKPNLAFIGLAFGWLLIVGSALAETQESMPPSTQAEQGSTKVPDDPSKIRSRGGFRDPIGPFAAPEGEGQPAPSEEVQGRGVTKGAVGNLKDKVFQREPAPQPGANPPPSLCHAETRMMTQCKCFNQTECQALTALFQNSCPAGSQHCEFVPLSRGPMPPLPPNLCGYQVPLTLTECSCHNATECQQLSPFCPGACPVGSQSCTCRPMRRGN